MFLYCSTKTQALVAHSLIIAAILIQQQTNAINVQPGDTLARIAAAQGVSVAALEAANPKISVNDLQPGQVVSIPASNAVTSKPTSAATTLRKSTSPKPPSSSPSSSTSKSSSSTSTTPAPPPTTTTPTPPPPAATTAELTSVGLPSCAPSPIGKYSDADDVREKTFQICDDNSHLTQAALSAPPYNGLLNGDSQEANSDDGNGGLASNEKGFNMTIGAVPGCVYPDGAADNFTVGHPMGSKSPNAWNCETVLTNCYLECNNKGMGGQLQAGCFLYIFEPDP